MIRPSYSNSPCKPGDGDSGGVGTAPCPGQLASSDSSSSSKPFSSYNKNETKNIMV